MREDIHRLTKPRFSSSRFRKLLDGNLKEGQREHARQYCSLHECVFFRSHDNVCLVAESDGRAAAELSLPQCLSGAVLVSNHTGRCLPGRGFSTGELKRGNVWPNDIFTLTSAHFLSRTFQSGARAASQISSRALTLNYIWL